MSKEVLTMPDKNVIDKKNDKLAKTKPGGLKRFGAFCVKLGKRLKNFFINMKAELKRVSWPDRKKLIQNTATVLAICILAGLLLWVIDVSLGAILNGIGFYSTKATTTVASTTAATSTAATTASGETTGGTTASGETTAGTTAAATTTAETTAAVTTTAGG
jgi:preprotein translocase subunit SecE